MFNFLFGKKKKRVSKKPTSKKPKTRKTRRMAFGGMSVGPFSSQNPDYGYNKTVKQTPSVISQSPSYVTLESNMYRPTHILSGDKYSDKQVPKDYVPIYGTGARFFTQTVPRVVSPEWDAMAQPDGSLTQVGWPFYGFTKKNSFGKKKRKVSRKVKSSKKLPKKVLKLCKKLKIKTTVKRGSKRVYKKLSVLKKQIKMKMKTKKH